MSTASATATTSDYQTLVNPPTIMTNHFLPDYTEHPKPVNAKRRPSRAPRKKEPPKEPQQQPSDDDDDVTFLQDFVAGGCAGAASVVVGHPAGKCLTGGGGCLWTLGALSLTHFSRLLIH